jgi:hypothetical protein
MERGGGERERERERQGDRVQLGPGLNTLSRRHWDCTAMTVCDSKSKRGVWEGVHRRGGEVNGHRRRGKQREQENRENIEKKRLSLPQRYNEVGSMIFSSCSLLRQTTTQCRMMVSNYGKRLCSARRKSVETMPTDV